MAGKGSDAIACLGLENKRKKKKKRENLNKN